MIDRYEREFKHALALLGVSVEVNRQLRYAYAQPRHEKMGSATVGQTVLALVLRSIYDESARTGQLNDDGEVICDLIELEEKYRLTTGRELPAKSELESLLKSMKRWGIAKKCEEENSDCGEIRATNQPFAIVIRPAIVDILGEAALQRLAQWHMTASSDDMANGDNTEIDGAGNGVRGGV